MLKQFSMTLQELIDTLNKFKDKQKQVKFLVLDANTTNRNGCCFQYSKTFDNVVFFEDPKNVWIETIGQEGLFNNQ